MGISIVEISGRCLLLAAKDEINVPIALSAFRDKKVSCSRVLCTFKGGLVFAKQGPLFRPGGPSQSCVGDKAGSKVGEV